MIDASPLLTFHLCLGLPGQVSSPFQTSEWNLGVSPGGCWRPGTSKPPGPDSALGQQGECGDRLVKGMNLYPGKGEPISAPSDPSQGAVATMDLTRRVGPEGRHCLSKTCIRKCRMAAHPSS